MEQHGIKINLIFYFIILSFVSLFGQSPLGNRVIFSDSVIFGIQLPEQGSFRPGSGVVRTLSPEKFSSFTHYQYGTTIKTNFDQLNLISLNPSPDAGILHLKRNLCNNCYGSRIEVRDRDDTKSLELSASFLHSGASTISGSYSTLFITNNTEMSTIKIMNGSNLIGTFNQYGFQYPQYTSTQRDALLNVEPGTTIYNVNTGSNQVWSGTVWQ